MSRRRSIALVAAVVGLLAVVAVAALGRPLGQSRGTGGLPSTFWSYVFTTAAIVFLLGILVSLTALFFFRIDRPGMEFARTRPTRSVLVIIVVSALIFFIGRHLDFLHHLLARHKPPKPGQGNSKPVKLGGKRGSPAAHFQWPELVVVLAVLLAAVLVYNRRWRTLLRPPLPYGAAAPEELAAALDESLDDLRSDPDLRRAIVAAYARMERALAAAGVPRDPAEAPLEYLERVLLSLDASGGAVRRLTDLFEWARFSHHEPEPPMREEAVDALVAVRDELRGRTPAATL